MATLENQTVSSLNKTTISAIIGVYVVLVLLWGLFIEGQILLSVYLAALGSLLMGLAYVAWQYFGGSGGSDSETLQS